MGKKLNNPKTTTGSTAQGSGSTIFLLSSEVRGSKYVRFIAPFKRTKFIIVKKKLFKHLLIYFNKFKNKIHIGYK